MSKQDWKKKTKDRQEWLAELSDDSELERWLPTENIS